VSEVAAAGVLAEAEHARQVLVLERKDLVAEGVFQAALVARPPTLMNLGPVDVGPQAAQRAGHHVPVLVALLERGPGPSRQVAVTRAVEEHAGLDGEQPALAGQDDRRHPLGARVDGNHAGVEREVHFGLLEQLVVQPLEHFRPDGHIAARPVAAAVGQPPLDFFANPAGQVANPVAEGHEQG